MIRIETLHYSVGNFALQDVSLHVQPGEYFVLLGPSGSGKTVLLECLCGLNRIDSGRIAIAGDDVTRLEPRNRGVGYLPQDYALFPDRSVASNALYGLESDRSFYGRMLLNVLTWPVWLGEDAARWLLRRPRQEPIDPRAANFLEMMGADHLARRLPGKLSGGEKQRVALARALAVKPRVLLLDEPVSALDEQTRDALCPELKRLQQETRTTTIHVCHNLAEMLAVADRVGIIRNGRILQVGTPQEILERPRSRVVAEFVQVGNLFTAKVQSSGEQTELLGPGGLRFIATGNGPVDVGSEVSFMIRPEHIHIDREPLPSVTEAATRLEGTVRMLTDSGPLVRLVVECHGELDMHVSLGKSQYNQRRFFPGDPVHLAIWPDDVHVLDGES